MASRKIILATNEVYHLATRSIASNPLCFDKKDHLRFINLLDFYRHQNPPLRYSRYLSLPLEDRENVSRFLKNDKNYLIEIIAFCLMTNHLHLLVKQLNEKGISTFMRKVQDGYAKYFNLKHKRRGSLFQSMFRAVRIETDEQLIHVSRYIHLNPSSAYLCKIEDLINYPWSSFPHYLGIKNINFVAPNLVLGLFKNIEAYKKFVFDQADYQKQLSNIKHLTLNY